MKSPALVQSSGKRKAAVARCTIRKGSGRVWVNRLPLEIHEPPLARHKIREPLLMIPPEKVRVLDIEIQVEGGGVMGQASAARTAVARGLVLWLKDAKLADSFKHYDRSLLVNDPRRKLPKRPGGRGARKRRQKSYR